MSRSQLARRAKRPALPAAWNVQAFGAPFSRGGCRRCRVSPCASGARMCVVGGSEFLRSPSRGD
eukprot:10936199-Alexandrium_andersonii.AAC.1